MVRLKTKNFEAFIRDEKNVRKALNNNFYTFNVAQKFKKMVRENLSALPSDTHSGHNTIESIKPYLKGPNKKDDGFKVYMEKYITSPKVGKSVNLIEVVEMGTFGHFIPRYVNGELVSVADHPGATCPGQ